MSNFTERAIRGAFISLLNERPLSKITVKDITDRCGINRNSFYYHYQDIPSLLSEVFTSEINRIISEYPSIDSMETCVKVAVGFSLENRKAILHVFNSINRDMFEQYLWRVCEHTVKVYLDTALPDVKLTNTDRDIINRYLVCEVFGLILGWLNTGMKENYESFFTRACEIRKGFLEEMIEYCENNPSGEQKAAD